MAKAEEKAESAPPPAKRGMMSWLLMGVVGLVAAGAGFAAPMFLPGGTEHKDNAEVVHAKTLGGSIQAFMPFGEVVVNLNEERLTRYLRVKLILVIDIAQEKPVTELIQKKKAILKNWLISYLSDKSLQEVSGATGVNRLRREIQDQFNNQMFPDGSEKIRDVLFEEFVIQ